MVSFVVPAGIVWLATRVFHHEITPEHLEAEEAVKGEDHRHGAAQRLQDKQADVTFTTAGWPTAATRRTASASAPRSAWTWP